MYAVEDLLKNVHRDVWILDGVAHYKYWLLINLKFFFADESNESCFTIRVCHIIATT